MSEPAARKSQDACSRSIGVWKLPYLFSLLGIVDPPAQMDGQIKRRRTLEAIKRIVLRESLNQEEELLLPQAPKSREEEQPY